MKKHTLLISILLCIFSTSLLAEVTQGYAIGIFDHNGKGENIQRKRETLEDYNGLCYSKVIVLGHYGQIKPKVTIGTSIGHLIDVKPYYNNRKIKIGSVLTFKHHNVTHGYLKLSYDKKILDFKVYIR